MILPPTAIAIRQNNYQLASSLEPHEGWMALSSLGVSVALFLASFVIPVAAKNEAADDTRTSTPGERKSEGEPMDMETETAV